VVHETALELGVDAVSQRKQSIFVEVHELGHSPEAEDLARVFLREGLADNAAVVSSNATGTFRLASNARAWDLGLAQVYGIRFSAVEAL
jgi:hypothetical protein